MTLRRVMLQAKGRATFESIFLVICLVAASGALESGRYAYLRGSTVRALSMLALVIALALLKRSPDLLRLARSAWPAVLPLAVAWLSLSWSVAPQLSLQRLLSLTTVSALGLLLASGRDICGQLRLIAIALLAVMMITVTVVWLSPQVGVMHGVHAGIWRGWYSSRNHLARAMALACPVAVLMALGGEWPRWRASAMLSAAVVLLYLAGSRTAPAVASVTMAGIAALLGLRRLTAARRQLVLRFAAAALLSSAVLAIVYAGPLFRWLGGDAALTERGQIWRVLFDLAADRPWLGYGFGAFWQGPHGPSLVAQVRLGRYPWHAHDGFLELALDLGLLGLGVFLATFVIVGQRAVKRGVASARRIDLWPATYCLFFVLSNLDETELVRYDSIYWIVYVAVVVSALRLPQPLPATTVASAPA